MSAFLGPVHHWLFKKVRLFEELEINIIDKVSQKYGQEAKEISNRMEEQYGGFIPQRPLEALIDTGNIHGWLQHRIVITETRQAATLKNIIERIGNDVVAIVEEAYIQQGTECGKEASSPNAIDIYKQLNNYLLDGMPCDHVNNLTVSEVDLLKWNTVRCLHSPYWAEVGADVSTMYKLRSSWIRAFVEAANSSYTYTVEGNGGNEGLVHTILKK